MKANRLSTFFLVLVTLSVVYLLNFTFASEIPSGIITTARIVITVICLVAWSIFHARNKPVYKQLAFTIMVLSLAFIIVSFFTTDFWNLNIKSTRGIALAKFSDSVIMSGIVILSFLMAGYEPKDLYLARGKLGAGIGIGIISFCVLAFLAIHSSDQHIEPDFWKKNLGWILMFVFFNAFQEELLFRGILLQPLNRLFKPVWSVVITAVVFSLAHMQVTYTPEIWTFLGYVLILGLIWGFLVHYTKSIIGSIIFHAGADLLIIIPVYLSLGAQV